jgi:hypothetical protein
LALKGKRRKQTGIARPLDAGRIPPADVKRAGSLLSEGGMAGADEIRWPRRVRQETIRRLYTLDAKGIVDEELIDEVGYALYARCLAIQTATRAHFGRAACPRCRSEIKRASEDWRRWRKDEQMLCACGWSATWGAYQRSYKGKQLVGGNAYPVFKAFINRWPLARTPRDKMLEIDGLIHACHQDAKKRWARPAACNVIEGRMTDMIAFLDELAYGSRSTEGLNETRRAWIEKPQLQAWRRWKSGEGERPWAAPSNTDDET